MSDFLTNEERQNRATERANRVSQALTDAARRARYSARSKGRDPGRATARQRTGTKILRLVLFGLLVVLPNGVSVAYFSRIASDQYEAEALFTVSSGSIPKMDDLGSATGLPPVSIVQDTMIVVSYIGSQTLVKKLQATLDLRALYGSLLTDRLSRFDASKPIEKLTTYWNSHASAAVAMPSGIVTLRVRAFTAADAQRIASAVVAQCDAMINQLNDRTYSDTVSASERDLERAGDMLKTSRLNYEKARNEMGVLDVGQAGAALNTLLTQLQGQLLKQQADFTTRSAYLSPKAPQMRLLGERISNLKSQIEGIKSQITNTQDATSNTLSQKLGTFADLDLQQKIAEKRYAEASTSLNMARILSERKMLYLREIVAPALPGNARYPNRVLNVIGILAASILGWFISLSLASVIRRRLA